MVLMKALEWAVGAFLVTFVVWQIAWPLLCGRAPFTGWGKSHGEEKESNGKQ